MILEYDDPAEGWTIFYADQFDSWQHNVRAVARTIAALRQIERDGAAHGLQYVGFRHELPAARPMTTGETLRLSAREEAVAFLEEHSNISRRYFALRQPHVGGERR